MRVVPNLKILVAEDDDGLRNIICRSLKQRGYEVVSASHGEEAFALLNEQSNIDVVLSDIRMPGGGGMELLKKIRSEIAAPPIVILMTGFTDVIFSVAIAAGAHSIITKPFTMKALIEHIEGLNIDNPGRRLIVF